jgi:peptidoglycan/LPS O-acetylase OafA/YrhL
LIEASRRNNFDFLRILAATLVLVSHCFLLSAGRNIGVEPLDILTGHQLSGGRLGVFIFFVISGYLVTESFGRTPDPRRFLSRRTARIFPGLIGVVLFAVLVIGPLNTTLPLADYFGAPETWTYFSNLTLYGSQGGLPGVFGDNPRMGVNGALWTLPFEFSFYILVLALGMMRVLRLFPVALYGTAVVLTLVLGTANYPGLPRLLELIAFFAAGMVLSQWRPICSARIAVACVVAVVGAVQIDLGIVALATAGTYVVYVVALHPRLRLPSAGRYGDFSYGTYLYGYPIQQTIIHLFGPNLTWWELLLTAFPLTLLLAAASWHFIEQPVLRLVGRGTVGSPKLALPLS